MRALILSRFLLCSVAVAAAGSLPAWSLFDRIEGDVVVATDHTPQGKLLAPVSPEKPVYYKGVSLGCRLGSIPGDHEPDVKLMTAFATKILRKQGYLGSPGDAHPPTLLLVLQWGYLGAGNTDKLWFLGYNPEDDIAYSPNPNMLGPEVFRRNMRSRETETILDLAGDNMYGIIITAFDHDSAKTEKPVVLWQTRIAFSARATNMAEALPKMLTVAASQIGQVAERPVLRDMDEFRKTKITFGELEIKGYGKDAEPERK